MLHRTQNSEYILYQKLFVLCVYVIVNHFETPEINRAKQNTWLTAMTFTNVVFPEYWSPTNVNSISSFQKRLLNQSKIRFRKANIFVVLNRERQKVDVSHFYVMMNRGRYNSVALTNNHANNWKYFINIYQNRIESISWYINSITFVSKEVFVWHQF